MSDSRVTEPVIAVERNLPGELMTRDQDMLDLMPDAPFRAAHPGLRIIGPVEFLKELKSPLMMRFSGDGW